MSQNKNKRQIILGLFFFSFLAVLYVFVFINPIPQDKLYHNFADERILFRVTNFWNVISNLPFLFVGVFALYKIQIQKSLALQEATKRAYIFLFFGVALVAFGSGYYHLHPNNETLVWDRLPMTISFMALFSIIISEFIAIKIGKQLLFPLLFLGLFSVLYWFFSEINGQGDLRFYALVQFLPMFIIPILLLLFKSPYTYIRGYWFLLMCYVLAKLFEYFDIQIFNSLGFISGHSLKHVVAAIGLFLLLNSYERRVLIKEN